MKYFKQLQKIIKNSYSPYSKFKTAAVAISDQGEYFGVNVENSSYPSGICAERNAVFNAITNGSKIINELYLLSSSTKTTVVPCAACLQVLAEFANPKTKIIVYNNKGKAKKYFFKELLPNTFTGKELK